jgi:uncharacterized protein
VRSSLLDTGPLVAFINRRDRFHQWARTEWDKSDAFGEAVAKQIALLIANIKPDNLYLNPLEYLF